MPTSQPPYPPRILQSQSGAGARRLARAVGDRPDCDAVALNTASLQAIDTTRGNHLEDERTLDTLKNFGGWNLQSHPDIFNLMYTYAERHFDIGADMGFILIVLIIFYGLTLPVYFAINSDLASGPGRWRAWPIVVSVAIPVSLLLGVALDSFLHGTDIAVIWSRSYWFADASGNVVVLAVLWAVLSGVTAFAGQWFGKRKFRKERVTPDAGSPTV